MQYTQLYMLEHYTLKGSEGQRPRPQSGLHRKSEMRYGLVVLSGAQYSRVIRIFDMFTSCYKMLSDHRTNDLEHKI